MLFACECQCIAGVFDLVHAVRAEPPHIPASDLGGEQCRLSLDPYRPDLVDVFTDIAGNAGQVLIEGPLRLAFFVPGVDTKCDQDAHDDKQDFAYGIAQVCPELPVHEEAPFESPEVQHSMYRRSARVPI